MIIFISIELVLIGSFVSFVVMSYSLSWVYMLPALVVLITFVAFNLFVFRGRDED